MIMVNGLTERRETVAKICLLSLHNKDRVGIHRELWYEQSGEKKS